MQSKMAFNSLYSFRWPESAGLPAPIPQLATIASMYQCDKFLEHWGNWAQGFMYAARQTLFWLKYIISPLTQSSSAVFVCILSLLIIFDALLYPSYSSGTSYIYLVYLWHFWVHDMDLDGARRLVTRVKWLNKYKKSKDSLCSQAPCRELLICHCHIVIVNEAPVLEGHPQER
jgi:hypothetical protein